MAMHGDTLGDEMKAAIDAEPGFQQTPYEGETMEAYRTRILRAQGNAIISHIVNNGVISVGVALSAPSACTAGGVVSAAPAVVATDNAGTIA